MLEAPRGLSHPQTSFIGTVCQGIHHTPFRAAHAPKNLIIAFLRQTTDHHTVKNDHKTIDLETRLQKRAWRNRDKAGRTTILHCSRPLSSSQTTTRPDRTRPAAHRPTASRQGHPENRTRPNVAGGGPGTQKHIRTTPARPPRGTREAHDLFHASTPAPSEDRLRHAGHTTDADRRPEKLRRKEVIQPHLPVRLPCYDLVPITSLTLDGSIPQGVRPPASGATHFHDLTGGVYKARERIHRGVADPRLLATPPSWSRVADSNPN